MSLRIFLEINLFFLIKISRNRETVGTGFYKHGQSLSELKTGNNRIQICFQAVARVQVIKLYVKHFQLWIRYREPINLLKEHCHDDGLRLYAKIANRALQNFYSRKKIKNYTFQNYLFFMFNEFPFLHYDFLLHFWYI